MALAMLMAAANLCHAQPLQYAISTAPTGDTIHIDITNGTGLTTVQGAVFDVHLRPNTQRIPVTGVSFSANRIWVALGERVLYGDGSEIRLSFTSGTVRDGAGKQLPYFRNAVVNNQVVYLDNASASAASHFVSSRGVVFGISDRGGGYASQINIGGANINTPGYGRGVQSAYRSGLHGNTYNPSQAGVRDNVGVLVRARQELSAHGPGGRVAVDPFRMALFVGETVFDHFENEAGYVVDNFPGDGGNSDTDGVAETGLGYPDELRSELEYETWWEDASGVTSAAVAMVRRGVSLRYAGSPGPIKCFGAQALRADGTPVIEERFRVTDISPAATPGLQSASDTDLSFVTASFAVRPKLSAGFRHLLWIEAGAGAWSSLDITKVSGVLRWKETRNAQLVLLVPTAGRGLVGEGYLTRTGTLDPSFNLVIAADGTDPDTANALGLAIPRNLARNRSNVVRVQADGRMSHREDRLIASFFEADLRASGGESYIYLRSRNRYTGLLSPRWFAGPGLDPSRPGDRGRASPDGFTRGGTELLRHEIYYLIGTPNEIRKAVVELGSTGRR